MIYKGPVHRLGNGVTMRLVGNSVEFSFPHVMHVIDESVLELIAQDQWARDSLARNVRKDKCTDKVEGKWLEGWGSSRK